MKTLLKRSVLLALVLFFLFSSGVCLDARAASTLPKGLSAVMRDYPSGSFFTVNGKACTHDCWCQQYFEGLFYISGKTTLQYSEQSRTRYTANGKGWICGKCSGTYIGVDHVGSDGRSWWAQYVLPDGSYQWEESQTVGATYETQYRYRDLTN